MNNSMCRTCLLNADNLISIFEVRSINNEPWKISDMLFTCTEIEISITDEFSHRICEICYDEIIRSYVFWKKCHDTSVFLKLKKEKINCVDFEQICKDEENVDNSEDNESVIEQNMNLNLVLDDMDSNSYEESIGIDNNEKDVLPKEGSYVNTIKSETVKHKNKKSTSPIFLKVSKNFELPRHTEILKDTFDYLCSVCGERFKIKTVYRDHMVRHDISRFGCTYCKKGFASNFQLKSHLLTHTGEKPFKCEVCGVAYSQNATLKIHLRKHTGEKPYQCKLCDASFVAFSYLRRHERVHLDPSIRPFSCLLCMKDFRMKENYKNHLKVHSGAKRQKCPHCDKTFAYRKGLVVHLRSHTGEKPYKCNICDKVYSQKHCLQGHLTKHHKQVALK